ncbi:MAG: hypothetical protein NVS4B3_15310 [Gemmatimonadaceae bacterium]
MVAARFLLDPFAEFEHAAYGGAGIVARNDGDGRWRAYLLLLTEIEATDHLGFRPAFEVGLGGGVRLAVVLRTAKAQRR